MRRLSDTLRRLDAARMRLSVADDMPAGRLMPLPAADPNPGQLKGWYYVPDGVADMPLVVVLHGCTQTAASYDRGSGWSALAQRYGFALLFPEQQRANNPNLCFNWFSPEDVRRDSGEVLSIRAMVGAMLARHPIDPVRVYVTGLSAGGAMTAALLACYPEIFAGGAVIAGLPFGAAATMAEAFDRMRGHGHPSPSRYAAQVRAASDHRGPWPTLAVWHGTTDATVSPDNADALLGQWRALTGCNAAPDHEDVVDGAVHRQWQDEAGRVCLEDYRIAGMGHGTPIATGGPTAAGSPMPYMLDVGLSSTWHIAQRWGLIESGAVPPDAVVEPDRAQSQGIGAVPLTVQATIEAALRQAGLMR